METFCIFVLIQYWYEWYYSCILLCILAEIKVKDMPRVCLRTLLLTWCHGNEASTRNCEKVFFLLSVQSVHFFAFTADVLTSTVLMFFNLSFTRQLICRPLSDKLLLTCMQFSAHLWQLQLQNLSPEFLISGLCLRRAKICLWTQCQTNT